MENQAVEVKAKKEKKTPIVKKVGASFICQSSKETPESLWIYDSKEDLKANIWLCEDGGVTVTFYNPTNKEVNLSFKEGTKLIVETF